MGLKKPLPLAVISAFVRLGAKYDIPKLRIEGQQRIFDEIPVDPAHPDTGAEEDPTWKLVTKPEHWFEVAIFARTTGLLSVLPYALYGCCKQYLPSEIIGGATRKDGTLISLSVPDQLACLAGYHAIYKAQAETTYSWAYAETAPAGCTSIICAHVRDKYLKDHFTALPVIGGLDPFDKLDLRHGGLCHVCAYQAQDMHTDGRQDFWELLPGLFSLPSWDELRKEREEM